LVDEALEAVDDVLSFGDGGLRSTFNVDSAWGWGEGQRGPEEDKKEGGGRKKEEEGGRREEEGEGKRMCCQRSS
jgi:hypothetical protein